MNDTIEVHIDCGNGTCMVGRCRYFSRGQKQSSVFEYADEWLDDPDSFAIDPENLPLRDGAFYFSSDKSALPGALRDSAPDRWGRQLIRRAFDKAGTRRTLSEMDYLLGVADHTRIGALRYRKEDDDSFERATGNFCVPPLIQLPALINAADAVHANTETGNDLRLLLNEGSPLGGARPKSAVENKDGTLSIAKFPKPDDDRSIPHGEVLAMVLARRAGLRAAECSLQDVAGRPVALIRRFDRLGGRRIPFLSAMSFLGLNDGDTATYTDIAEIIRMHSSAPTEDLHELWRRVVFNVLVGNLDDHLRNHGFLHDRGGRWRLSPAYDLNPVPLAEKTRELATWISEQGPEADLDLAREAAPFFALKKKQADTIIEEVLAALTDWQSIARRMGMNRKDIAVYATAINVG